MTSDDVDEPVTHGTQEPPPLRARVDTAVDRFTARWASFSHTIEAWARESSTDSVVDRCAAFVRHSWIFRWLTAEPPSDPIVIDLRETRTIGPVVAFADWLASRLEGRRHIARLGHLRDVLVGWLERMAVPLQSTMLLGVVTYTIAVTWRRGSPLWLAALAMAAVAGLLGLTVSQSRDVLHRSRAVTLAVALVAPPENGNGATDGRR